MTYSPALQYVRPRAIVRPATDAYGDSLCADCAMPVVFGVDAHTLSIVTVTTALDHVSTLEYTHISCGADQHPGAYYIRDLGPGRPSISYATERY